jgi:hypothetical protein
LEALCEQAITVLRALIYSGLGSYIQQNKKKKPADDPYADLFSGSLFDAEDDPRNAQLMQGLQAAQALRPQFQSMQPVYQSMPFQQLQLPTLGQRR